MNLRTKLAATFLPTRRLVGVEEAVVQPGGVLGGQQWIVPRADCQYRRVDLSAVPQRQRAAAARLAAARHEPAPGAATHVAWREGIAHLWTWPSPPPEVADGEQRWLPESVMFAPPSEDGARLVVLSKGVEGQLWERGQLLQSQWWPTPPALDAWQRFLRAGGLEPSGEGIEARSLAWSAPWGEGQRSVLPGSAAARERLGWLAAGALVVLLLGWELTGLLRWSSASSDLAARLDATRTEIAPVLASRERAEQALAEADRLLGLQTGASDYEMMAQVVAALPEGTELKGWNRDPDKLRALVATSETDPRKAIAAFVGKPALQEVSAVPGTAPGTLMLEFTLPAAEAATP